MIGGEEEVVTVVEVDSGRQVASLHHQSEFDCNTFQ